ncbi:hypothetical protein K32_37260 [Kaistia sp. 32K]|uniref:DUF1178 family protein n=1 Tax=Kaistia sp. 32K TaxID=2795690 RepID=UPI001914F698|nr:DUF1178 family protein [Kaistia sp. 32K]BCP55109.1 hypothetical protein K32_37260 [Kaistia sp. 32K]
MIRYNLVCVAGHDFESWFRDAGAFDKAAAAHAVSCPQCGTTDVVKALMAPSVATARKREAAALAVASPDPRQVVMVEMMRQLRRHVTENADYVGDKFAEEARKIHYQETEARGIYGEASPEEARSLIEEGVEFLPLPALPEEGN